MCRIVTESEPDETAQMLIHPAVEGRSATVPERPLYCQATRTLGRWNGCESRTMRAPSDRPNRRLRAFSQSRWPVRPMFRDDQWRSAVLTRNLVSTIRLLDAVLAQSDKSTNWEFDLFGRQWCNSLGKLRNRVLQGSSRRRIQHLPLGTRGHTLAESTGIAGPHGGSLSSVVQRLCSLSSDIRRGIHSPGPRFGPTSSRMVAPSVVTWTGHTASLWRDYTRLNTLSGLRLICDATDTNRGTASSSRLEAGSPVV